MKIGILGTGGVGQTLSIKLRSLGHDVMIGTRDVQKTLANEEKDPFGNPPFKDWHKEHDDIALGSFSEAATHGELILNATKGNHAVNALQLAGEGNLDGKVVIDISNPLDFSQGMPPFLVPELSNTTSVGEELQKAFPNTHVVKTLNTMNAQVMVNPSMVPGDHNVFISGNDEGAKEKVGTLLQEIGWPAKSIIDLGDISTARGTEQILPLWVRLYGKLQKPDFNFHIAQG